MKKLVDIFNTNDLRYLLYVEVLPEQYPTEELVPIFDDILKEYEELRGDRFYSNFLEESFFALKDRIKLISLYTIQENLLCGQTDNAIKIIDEFKYKIKNYQDCDMQIKHIMQKLQVKAMKEDEKDNSKQSYGSMCADIEYYTGVKCDDKTTVSTYCRHKQRMDLIIKDRQKKVKNG